MSGWLLIATLTLPRRRIIDPLPAIAELFMTVMPVVLPWSSSPTFEGGSGIFAISICEMLLPISRCRDAAADRAGLHLGCEEKGEGQGGRARGERGNQARENTHCGLRGGGAARDGSTPIM